MAAKLPLPDGLDSRIQRFVTRRAVRRVVAAALLALALTGLLIVLAISLDHLVLLPATIRRLGLLTVLLPGLSWVIWLVRWLPRSGASADDLRRLDNRTDDMRAAMNLAHRAAAGEAGLNLELAQESARRAGDVVVAPLPDLPVERRALKRGVVVLVVALLGLLAIRLASPDLHTVVRRFAHPGEDYGSVGQRKFQVTAEVWQNAAVVPETAAAPTASSDKAADNGKGNGKAGAPAPSPSTADGPAAAAATGDVTTDDAPRKLRDLTFLRETLTADGWQPAAAGVANASADHDLADVLAGYNPLALVNRDLPVLEGDRLVLRFNAVDQRRDLSLDGVEFLHVGGDRTLPIRYQQIGQTGLLTIDKVEDSHAFQLRSGAAFSPLFRVQMTPRPSPTRLVVFESPPAQYGSFTRQTVIRDRARQVNLNRISGLPGARLALEFTTPYGPDLDRDASWVQVGKSLRLPLRYLTSRTVDRTAKGADTRDADKVWSCEFTLDESLGSEPKLYLHLVTKTATFAGRTIDNRYDEPFLLHTLEDLAPTVEISMLPSRTHFASDDAFAFRYHYLDDYGIAEIGLELQQEADSSNTQYVPLELRAPEKAGETRREDDVMQVIDLTQYRGGFLAYSVVVKDVNGQVAKTSPVAVTFSNHVTETLLPKLAGGWQWAWGHAPNNFMKREGDLRATPAAKSIDGFRAGLAQLVELVDGTEPVKAADLKALGSRLDYQYAPYLTTSGFEDQPFAFHFRDYPYYFERQASTYLGALAGFDGRRIFADVLAALPALQAAADPRQAPEWATLKAARDEAARQGELLQLALDSRAETERRVYLLRAAYFCETITRRMAETDVLFNRLLADAGPVPADLKSADPWRVYPAWVMQNATDPNLRQQARLVSLRIRGLDRKMNALNTELGRLLGQTPDELAQMDVRLVAAIQMTAGLGPSVLDLDRNDLKARCALLSRFLRLGILAGDSTVYREIDRELGPLGALATAAAGRVPEAMRYEAALTDLLATAREIVDARLKYAIGKPEYKEDMSATVRRNRESRMRTQVEELERQANLVLFGETFKTGADLSGMVGEMRQLQSSIRTVLEWSADYPALASQAPMLNRALTRLDQFNTAADRVAALQRDVDSVAGFAALFDPARGGDLAQAPGAAGVYDALSQLAALPPLATTIRTRVADLAQARRTVPAVAAADESDAVKQARAALAALEGAGPALQTSLADLFAKAGAGLTAIAARPADTAPAVPGETTAPVGALPPPHPLVSAHTSTFFDVMAPDAVLARLAVDLQRFAATPARADAVFETNVDYFANLATDTAKDVTGNPVDDYLRARIALALIGCSPHRLETFVATYGGDNNAQRDRVLNYFGGKNHEGTKEVTAWINAQSYPTPTVPAELAPLVAGYLDAAKAKQLDTFLATRRAARMTELQGLAARLAPLRDRYEALVRVDALHQSLVALLDDLRLHHFAADDIRADVQWSDLVEQAEGLDRDLRAGRLTAIAGADRLALHAGTAAFRGDGPEAVLADAGLLAQLRTYEGDLARVRAALLPVAAETAALIVADRRTMEQDLAVVIVASLGESVWYERQLQAEYQYQVQILGSLSGIPRIKAPINLGSFQPSINMMALTNLTAFAFRSACVFQAQSWAGAPTPETRNGLLHDLSVLTIYKTLPEFYYDNYPGRLALRRYAAGSAPDSFAEQMLESWIKGRNLLLDMARYHVGPRRTDLPSRDEKRLDQLNTAGVMPVIFRVEDVVADVAKTRQAVFEQPTTATRQAAIARIRGAFESRGVYWRDLGRRLATVVEAGSPLLDANVADQLSPEAIDSRLATQERELAIVLARATADESISGGDLQVLTEASHYLTAWRAALAAHDTRAAGDSFSGYRDIHESLVSYIESQRGNLFPDPPVYALRLRYRHKMFHLESFNAFYELLAEENRWFDRADDALAGVYDSLLLAAWSGLDGTAPDAAPTAFAFSRYVDTKYRYMMAHATPGARTRMPPPAMQIVDVTMPEHLTRGLTNALTIDLPEQDNRLMRKLYYEAIQETREASEGVAP